MFDGTIFLTITNQFICVGYLITKTSRPSFSGYLLLKLSLIVLTIKEAQIYLFSHFSRIQKVSGMFFSLTDGSCNMQPAVNISVETNPLSDHNYTIRITEHRPYLFMAEYVHCLFVSVSRLIQKHHGQSVTVLRVLCR